MDQETKEALNELRDFLSHNMVTKQEFDEGLEALPNKEDFRQLQTSVDGIAKRFKDTDV